MAKGGRTMKNTERIKELYKLYEEWKRGNRDICLIDIANELLEILERLKEQEERREIRWILRKCIGILWNDLDVCYREDAKTCKIRLKEVFEELHPLIELSFNRGHGITSHITLGA